MLCHVLAFAGYVIPFGHIAGPLVLWLLKRKDDAAVDTHGKESVNFQISMTIYSVALFVVFMFTVFAFNFFGAFLMFLVFGAVAVLEIIFVVRAALAASRGQAYRYPLTLRFVK